jgi:hypothetical protein
MMCIIRRIIACTTHYSTTHHAIMCCAITCCTCPPSVLTPSFPPLYTRRLGQGTSVYRVLVVQYPPRPRCTERIQCTRRLGQGTSARTPPRVALPPAQPAGGGERGGGVNRPVTFRDADGHAPYPVPRSRALPPRPAFAVCVPCSMCVACVVCA